MYILAYTNCCSLCYLQELLLHPYVLVVPTETSVLPHVINIRMPLFVDSEIYRKYGKLSYSLDFSLSHWDFDHVFVTRNPHNNSYMLIFHICIATNVCASSPRTPANCLAACPSNTTTSCTSIRSSQGVMGQPLSFHI
jgi:hypothetical protein